MHINTSRRGWFAGLLESRNVLDGRVLVFGSIVSLSVSGTIATPFMPMETPPSQAIERVSMCETGRRGGPPFTDGPHRRTGGIVGQAGWHLF